VNAAALEVSDLCAPFGAAPGLRDVSFTVAAGERLVIVGGSGAGKTTLLRAIAGLGPTSGGRIAIGGRDVGGQPPERRDAIYLHQTPLLFPHLSVAENVAFPLRVRRVPEHDVGHRVRSALATVQLDGFDDRTPRTLSGGQRHRVALARAMVARPAVLLLDEPLAALDPALRDEVRASMLALQREYGPALVLVTHDLDEAGILADRIGVLLDGGIAQTAPPGELFSAPASLRVARFLGIPNVVPGVLKPAGEFESAIGTIILSEPRKQSPGGPRVAVFRPGAARLVSGGPLTGRVTAVRQGPRTIAVQLDAGGLVLEIAPGADKLPNPGAVVTWELDPQQCVFLDP
jgi:ABC-type Fe3+/spermidine/putrescine transport system ATPase subunit